MKPHILSSEIRSLPKIDLHRHVLGSARTETLWTLARKYGVASQSATFEDFKRHVVHTEPPGSLSSYVRPWDMFRRVVQRPEDIRQIAAEAALDAGKEGIRYVEFRGSLPGMALSDGSAPQTQIPADEYLDAIREGFATSPGVVCRLVVSIVRHAVRQSDKRSIQRYATQYLDAVSKFRPHLVVGADLTGIESGWPAILFEDFFAAIRSAGLPVTVHAGETEGPSEIWAAIDKLGAVRIGHGTTAPEDPDLVRELIKRNIVLEVCPTAGWLVGALSSYHSHPVLQSTPRIPYVICTDNPVLNASTLSRELCLAAAIVGEDLSTFLQTQFNIAREAAFVSHAVLTSASPTEGRPG